MAGWATRRGVRIAVLIVCLLAMVGLLGTIVRQSWRTNSAAADVVRMEQRGAEILHPMTTLLAELVAAQSSAVRGDPVDTATVRKALAAVAEVDARHGVALATRQRLADLTVRVDAAFARGETGRPAYDTYTGIVTLAVDMMRRVGDTSHLIHDPDLDSYYLMEAAIIQLPDSMVYAGRAADLIAIAGGAALAGEDAVRAAVARFRVSAAAEEVSAGLTQSVDFTNRAELSTNIADRLDAFRSAADSFAPPTMLAELSTAVPADELAENARRVYAAANPLAHRLLSELQALLDQRAAKLSAEWRLTVILAGLAGIVLTVMAWTLGRTRTRPGPRAGRDSAQPGSGNADGRGIGTLSYAREILGADQFVDVGRPAAARTRGNGDAG